MTGIFSNLFTGKETKNLRVSLTIPQTQPNPIITHIPNLVHHIGGAGDCCGTISFACRFMTNIGINILCCI